MIIRDLISLGSRYMILGMLIAVVVAVFFLVYYIFVKRKQNTKLDIKRLALYAIFVCYLCVVFGATMLSRGNIGKIIASNRYFILIAMRGMIFPLQNGEILF